MASPRRLGIAIADWVVFLAYAFAGTGYAISGESHPFGLYCMSLGCFLQAAIEYFTALRGSSHRYNVF